MDLWSYGSIVISKRDSQLLGRSSTILVAGFLHSSSTETMASGLLSVSNLNWITTHDHSKVKACTHSIYTTKSLLVPTAGIHCRQSWNSRPTHVSHSPRKIKPLTTFRADLTVGAAEPDPIPTKFSKILDAFWRFLRPHTIRGTVIGSTALVSRALLENSHLINWSLLPKALCGVLALICGNGYIVGINQIYDIGIDKVNKPFLPIAAGDLSVKEAWFLVLLFAAVGITIVIKNFGPFISILYGLGLFLGSIYSVPPFRMKRYPVAAFLIIATVRGFLLNFGVYYSVRAALGLSFQWSPAVAFITTFVTLFALVIAITKDLPDVEGDRKFQISTLATKLGVRNITFLGSGLLLVNYVGAIVAAVYMPQVFRHSLMISTHCILAVGLVFQTWILDQSQYTKDAIAKFYRFIWNLFYAEYLLFPFL